MLATRLAGFLVLALALPSAGHAQQDYRSCRAAEPGFHATLVDWFKDEDNYQSYFEKVATTDDANARSAARIAAIRDGLSRNQSASRYMAQCLDQRTFALAQIVRACAIARRPRDVREEC